MQVFTVLRYFWRNSESCKLYKMELFVKTVEKENSSTIFAKTFILDVWQGSWYASELASEVTKVSFLNQSEYQR